MTLASDVAGEGPTIRVHFSKREGPAVRYVSGDDPSAAAAIREVDLQKKYHLSPQQVADRLGISTNRAKALRDHLGIDADPSNMHVFEFGSQRMARFSDTAMRVLAENNNQEAIDAAWAARRNRGRRAAAAIAIHVDLPAARRRRE
jgi:DNA-binding CsgD family transcriptional regulator